MEHREMSGCASDMVTLVLAAGKGVRMGGCKALTRLGGRTFLERILQAHAAAGAPHLLVVTGAEHEAVQAHAASLGLATVHNPRHEEGMFTSILAGLQAVAGTGCSAVGIHPVDIPCIRPATIRRLRAVWEADPDPARILLPLFDGRTGHPPILGAAHFQAVADWTGPGGLGGYFDACGVSGPVLVPVADEGIHRDADTPADLAALEAWLPRQALPTLAETEALLRLHQPHSGVVTHSRAVALAARRLAEALTVRGQAVDAEAAFAAGLLHDIAKGAPAHAVAGATLVREAGFVDLEEAIALHPGVPGEAASLLARVLALADKYASGDEFVDLTTRFGRKAARFQENPEALQTVSRRLAESRTLEAGLETLLGRPPLEVVRTGEAG